MSGDDNCQYRRATGESAQEGEFTSFAAQRDFNEIQRRGSVIFLSTIDSEGKYSIPLPSEFRDYESSGVLMLGSFNRFIKTYVEAGGRVDFLSLDGRFDTSKGDKIDPSDFIEVGDSSCFRKNVHEYANLFNASMINELRDYGDISLN